MNDEPDAHLIQQTLAGCEQAFACLVRRYQNYAYGVASGLVPDFALAQDIVQESFLTAYRNLGKLRDPESFGSCLHGIVNNTARRARRELARVERLRQALVPERGLLPEPEAPDVSAEEAERRRLVRIAIERLGDTHREVVGLHYGTGLSYPEIARFLGITATAVQGRLQRARAQLRDELTMVQDVYQNEELPEDFVAQIQQVLRDVAAHQRSQADAVQALAKMGGSAIDELCRVVGAEGGPMQQVAAKALCRIGDGRARGPILKLLYTDQPWNTWILFVHGQVLRVPGIREALIEEVRTGGQSGTPRDRVTVGMAIGALSHLAGDSEVIELASAMYRDQDRHLRARGAAYQALWRLLPEDHESLAIEGLNDAAPTIRLTAAFCASREDLVPPIAACLKAFERGVVWWGRRCAGELILRHGEPGLRVMEGFLDTGTAEERSTAAVVLAGSGSSRAFEVLKQELFEQHPERIRMLNVSISLAEHYGEDVARWIEEESGEVPDLSRLLWTLSRTRTEPSPLIDGFFEDGPPAVRTSALRILVRHHGAGFLPQLRRCLAEGRPRKVAQEAFWQVNRMREEARPMLQEMLGSELWTERKAAVCLLRRWGELTEDQRRTAEGDEHKAVRNATYLRKRRSA